MLTSPLSERFGKRNFYMMAMSLTALLGMAYYFVMSSIPAIGALIAIAAPWFYDLDGATVKQMTGELAERRTGTPRAAAAG